VCHQGIESNRAVDSSLRPSMASCESCHEARGVAAACASCHLELDVDMPPTTHGRLWTRRHGDTVHAESIETIDDCTMCHTESSCTSCHQELAPQSHTNFWRTRGHGSVASMDRQSCAVCHRTDSCDSCHADIQPLSHRASFGGSKSTHCFGCHFPLQENTCFVCHKNTSSHGMATPKPSDHSPALDCRQCHGLDQPLPHVDNGTDCNFCHM
jgi:hypothetical protein